MALTQPHYATRYKQNVTPKISLLRRRSEPHNCMYHCFLDDVSLARSILTDVYTLTSVL